MKHVPPRPASQEGADIENQANSASQSNDHNSTNKLHVLLGINAFITIVSFMLLRFVYDGSMKLNRCENQANQACDTDILEDKTCITNRTHDCLVDNKIDVTDMIGYTLTFLFSALLSIYAVYQHFKHKDPASTPLLANSSQTNDESGDLVATPCHFNSRIGQMTVPVTVPPVRQNYPPESRRARASSESAMANYAATESTNQCQLPAAAAPTPIRYKLYDDTRKTSVSSSTDDEEEYSKSSQSGDNYDIANADDKSERDESPLNDRMASINNWLPSSSTSHRNS